MVAIDPVDRGHRIDVAQILGLPTQGGHQIQQPAVQQPQRPTPAVALGLAPPGLDNPQSQSTTSPNVEQSWPSAPPSSAAVHVWAIEAKMKADQAQARQQEWAEKMQRQYLQGQEVLRVLRESGEETHQEETGSAFDRLVKQMGLQEEAPRAEQTPSPKRQVWETSSPPAVGTNSRKGGRRRGDEERHAKAAEPAREAAARRNRGGRKTQASSYPPR